MERNKVGYEEHAIGTEYILGLLQVSLGGILPFLCVIEAKSMEQYTSHRE